MSAFVLFAVGSVLFAVTVYGTVIAAGLTLTKRTLEDDAVLRSRVDDDQLDSGLPTDARF